MSGPSSLRKLFDMASQAVGSPSTGPQPTKTKYYFAYGSNLHLKQMKRRCPNSKYIGCARLANYRWQINERGYANVVEAEGHWVDGLVYEIDPKDESRLDINEGVSKNAYAKRYLNVLLRRAHGALYRRPTSWIVDRGGPAKITRMAKQGGQKPLEHPKHWEQNVLVYISLTCIQDSKPKEEYIGRINLGVADARALGIESDYISNCIRPFIPSSPRKTQASTPARTNQSPAKKQGRQSAQRGGRVAAPRSTAGRSPARKSQAPTHPEIQTQTRPQGPRVRFAEDRSPNRKPAAQQPLRQAPPRSTAPRPPASQVAPALPARAPGSVVSTRPTEQALLRVPAMNTRRQNALDRRRASSDVGAPPPLPPRPLRRLRSIPVIVIEETPSVVRFR